MTFYITIKKQLNTGAILISLRLSLVKHYYSYELTNRNTRKSILGTLMEKAPVQCPTKKEKFNNYGLKTWNLLLT